MWVILIIGAIIVCYLFQEHPIAALIIGGVVVLFFIIRAIYRNSPAGQKKAQEKEEQIRLAEEQTKQRIKNTMKKEFNIDFNVSFHIGSELAIDRLNNLIYLTYCENTLDYIGWVKPVAIFNYSLSPEYVRKNAKKEAIKGTILAGTAGAVIGAASANDSVSTGNYILSISFEGKNGKYHHSYTICSKEEGQEVIRYIEEAQKK